LVVARHFHSGTTDALQSRSVHAITLAALHHHLDE
jgi:hypothetical protein